MGSLGAVGHGHKKGSRGGQYRLSSEGRREDVFMVVKSTWSQET